LFEATIIPSLSVIRFELVWKLLSD